MGCRIFSFVPASTKQRALSMHFLCTSLALHSVLSHVRVSRIQAKALLECGAWVLSGLADPPRDLNCIPSWNQPGITDHKTLYLGRSGPKVRALWQSR